MKKRILALFLVILLFAALLPMSVSADSMSKGKTPAHDCPSSAFTDIPAESNWAHKGIDFCVESGLMNGISKTAFSPEGTLTRGQLVTILYRVVEEPAVKFRDIFSDVAADRYYADAVIWAANNEIVTGYADGSFRPQAVITREQIATIFYRLVGAPAVSGTLDFPDGRTVSKYAKDAMLWATQSGLINGIKSGSITNLSPGTSASRAQIASIIMRFLEKYEKENLKGYGADAGEDRISLAFTPNRWPIVDGATAFLPFYQEMAARMLGVSTEEAADYIMCSTTDYAYPYLWEKKVDLVFCLRPSADQVKRAAQNGVVFEEVPFANEGFVFFVNKDNPVDSITVEQLHDIYAGKITNWKELGGNDEKIIAYQRTEGSGSQTGLYLHVIAPEEVQEPPTENRIATMNEIIDVVANYQNAAGALGYSYRYFVTNMHYDEQIKMLRVNGVYPDYNSIADGSYPLISDVCAVFREDESADSGARKIARWCASSQGAVLAKELGYVPTAEAIGTLYKENDKKTDDVVIDYADGNPCPECTVMSTHYINNLTVQNIRVANSLYVQISGLKNKAVQDAINAKIYDTFMELSEADYPHYPGIRTRMAMCDECDDSWIFTTVRGNFNNILSITFEKTQEFWKKGSGRYGSDSMQTTDIRTLNLDLSTGKEIFIGDLFADSMDGIAHINEKIAEESSKPESFDEPSVDYESERAVKIYFRKAFEGINLNQKFYVSAADGALHIILDDENPEIANLFAPTDYAIEMQGINAYESRFMTAESIFENGASSPSLFAHSFDKNNAAVDYETISLLREGRDLSARMIFNRCYDGRTLDLLKTFFLDDAYLARLRTDAEAIYDAYLQEGYPAVKILADVVPNVRRIGDYTNITCNINYNVTGYDENGNLNFFFDELWDVDYFCFGADGKPVSLSDLFVPSCDYTAIMEEAAVRMLKESFGDQYSEEIYRAMFRGILENIDGFSIESSSLRLQCKDVTNILTKYIPLSSKDYDTIRNILQNLPYKELGAENLTIFN